MAEAPHITLMSDSSSISPEILASLRESRRAARGQQAEAAGEAAAVEPKTAAEIGALQSYFNRTLEVIGEVFRGKNFSIPEQAQKNKAITNLNKPVDPFDIPYRAGGKKM